MSVIIRECCEKDVSEIEKVALNCWELDRYHVENKLDKNASSKFWAGQAVSNCRNKECVTFVAELDNKIVGFINISENKGLSRIFGKKYGVIMLLGVDKKYQGKKIGEQLVRKAVDYFKENNFKKIDVGTDCSNISAIHVYQKNGFRPIHFAFTLTLDLE